MNSKLLKKINKAHQSKDGMLQLLENTDPDLLLFKPDDESWNMIQVAEHCKNIESAVLFSLNKYRDYPSRPVGIKQTFNALLLKIALNSRFKYKVPAIKGLVPEGKSSLQEIKNEWNNVRNKLIKYLENFPEVKLNHAVFKHPHAGFLNIVNTIDFIHNHTLHHQKQISRLSRTYREMNES